MLGRLTMMFLTAVSGSAITLLAQQSASGRTQRSERPHPISLPNVEDMAVLPGGRWLIVSSMSSDDVKSGLYAVEMGTARFERLYPDGGTADKSLSSMPAATPSGAACPGELAPGAFSGHGISYKPVSVRGGELYVVNHGGRESIEIFDVELPHMARAMPRLRWKGCILAPAGTVGNAVTWTPDGRVYATVTPVVNGMPQPGDVRFWTPSAGWTHLAGSDVQVPAGIAASPAGDKIYVTSFLDRKVVEVSLGRFPERREVSVEFGADNVSLAKDGALLVGGLEGDPADIMRSCPGSNSPACRFTGYVARVEPKSFHVTCTLELGPTVTTTATQVGNLLWLGSSRAPRIWRAPVAALKSCPGRIDVGAGTTGHE